MLIKLMRSKTSLWLFTLVSLALLIFAGGLAIRLAQGSFVETPGILYDIGAKPVTLSQLKSENTGHDLSFYWLGEVPDLYMTIDHLKPGIITLAYSANAYQNSVVSTPDISVTTNNDSVTYEQSMKGTLHVAIDSVISNSRGDVVIINSSLLNEMVVEIRGSEKIISVSYSSRQSEESLLRDSEKLKLFDPA